MVVVLDELLDAGDQIAYAAETAAANCLLCNQPEPALHLIEPASIGRRGMDVKAGPLRQPQTHLGMLVGGVVVDNQMHVEIFGDRLVDALEKAEKLLMAVPRLALGEDRSSAANSVVVAMADIIVGCPLPHNRGP